MRGFCHISGNAVFQQDEYLSQIRAKIQCNISIVGVYFSSKVENIKFVDFCGKYRLPLLEYLCSPNCARNPIICASSESESEDDVLPMAAKMKKVLLG